MMMVDGPDSTEARAHSEETGEMNSGLVTQRDEDTPQQQVAVPTTTISTIAVQSGETRVVIALLQVRNIPRAVSLDRRSSFRIVYLAAPPSSILPSIIIMRIDIGLRSTTERR